MEGRGYGEWWIMVLADEEDAVLDVGRWAALADGGELLGARNLWRVLLRKLILDWEFWFGECTAQVVEVAARLFSIEE